MKIVHRSYRSFKYLAILVLVCTGATSVAGLCNYNWGGSGGPPNGCIDDYLETCIKVGQEATLHVACNTQTAGCCRCEWRKLYYMCAFPPLWIPVAREGLEATSFEFADRECNSTTNQCIPVDQDPGGGA